MQQRDGAFLIMIHIFAGSNVKHCQHGYKALLLALCRQMAHLAHRALLQDIHKLDIAATNIRFLVVALDCG